MADNDGRVRKFLKAHGLPAPSKLTKEQLEVVCNEFIPKLDTKELKKPQLYTALQNFMDPTKGIVDEDDRRSKLREKILGEGTSTEAFHKIVVEETAEEKGGPQRPTCHPTIKCFCGIPSSLWVSKTPQNYDRRFVKCGLPPGHPDRCKLFAWCDAAPKAPEADKGDVIETAVPATPTATSSTSTRSAGEVAGPSRKVRVLHLEETSEPETPTEPMKR